MENKQNSTAHSIKIVAVLTLICVGIALLLAFVNQITKDVIAEAAAKEQQDAILALFNDDSNDNVKSVAEYQVGDDTVYAVLEDDVLVGYAIPSVGSGFGGEIKTMVGFQLSGGVTGVRIISMSETPGVGSKTKSDDFLARFFGLSENAVIGENVDGITGATISSKGVAEAVNHARNVPVDVPTMAQDLGAALTVDFVKTAGGNN